MSDSFSISSTREKSPVFNKSDSLATRAKKMQAAREGTQDKPRRIVQVKELKASVDENTNHDVQFLIQVNKCCPVTSLSELFNLFIYLCTYD